MLSKSPDRRAGERLRRLSSGPFQTIEKYPDVLRTPRLQTTSFLRTRRTRNARPLPIDWVTGPEPLVISFTHYANRKDRKSLVALLHRSFLQVYAENLERLRKPQAVIYIDIHIYSYIYLKLNQEGIWQVKEPNGNVS